MVSTAKRIIGSTPDEACLDLEHVTKALRANTPNVALLLLDTKYIQEQLRDRNEWIRNHQAFSEGRKVQLGRDHPAWQAAKKGYLEVLKRTVQNVHPDLYITHDTGSKDSKFSLPWSLLHYASHFGHFSIAHFLVQSGIDPNTQWLQQDSSTSEPTPLALALEKGHYRISKMLMHASPAVLNSQYNLCEVISFGREELVQTFLHSGTNIQHLGSITDPVPLHRAIRSDNIDIVRLLLDRGAEMGPLTQPRPAFPLLRRSDLSCALDVVVECAGNLNSVAIAELLLHHGAVWDEKAKEDDVLLHGVTIANNVPLMKLLLEPANVSTNALLGFATSPQMASALLQHGLDVNGASPSVPEPILMQAPHLTEEGSHDSIEIFRLLLPLHKNINNARDNEGETALTICCHAYNVQDKENTGLERVKLLLSHGANHSLANHHGLTALHYAVRSNFVEGIRELVAAGADTECKDVEGLTPLHHAARFQHDESLKELLRLGVDLQAKTARGWTALHMAFRDTTYDGRSSDYNHDTYPSHFWLRFPAIKLLLTHGADPNDASDNGVPSIQIPSTARGRDLEKLLDLGADPCKRDLDGNFVLVTLASFVGTLRDVELLLPSAGAKVVNFQDHRGRTALMSAAIQCSVSMAQLLLHYGADINAVNRDGLTALDMFPDWEQAELIDAFETFMRSEGALRGNELNQGRDD